MTWTFRISDLYLIQKEKLSVILFHVGMLIAFLGSLNPWFMWPIGAFYYMPATMLIAISLVVSETMGKPVYNRTDYILPLLAFVLFVIYECFSTGRNINAYIMILFRIPVIFALFRIDSTRLLQLTTFIAKVMGVLLAASLAGHFLYIFGFSLPGRSAEFGEYYTFTNHYLFLLDDRNMFAIFPRFNSYFPEPSHIGSASAFLLFAQWGRWKKWYNIVLIATIFFSFSLASYIYLTAIIFLNLWIERKQIIKKLLVVVAIFAGGVIAAFTYNRGDNLVHDLILLRLEVDDGKLVGDNRVTDNFQKDYDNFLASSDILLGRRMEDVEFGNAGFKTFFYEHGLIGILLISAFYFLAIKNSPNKRAVVSVLIVAGLYFYVSAFMLFEKVIIPLYAAAYLNRESKRSNNENVLIQHDKA